MAALGCSSLCQHLLPGLQKYTRCRILSALAADPALLWSLTGRFYSWLILPGRPLVLQPLLLLCARLALPLAYRRFRPGDRQACTLLSCLCTLCALLLCRLYGVIFRLVVS